ncbi:hypothetical protein OROMI_021945 [Orobanche minor]
MPIRRSTDPQWRRYCLLEQVYADVFLNQNRKKYWVEKVSELQLLLFVRTRSFNHLGIRQSLLELATVERVEMNLLRLGSSGEPETYFTRRKQTRKQRKSDG